MELQNVIVGMSRPPFFLVSNLIASLVHPKTCHGDNSEESVPIHLLHATCDFIVLYLLFTISSLCCGILAWLIIHRICPLPWVIPDTFSEPLSSLFIFLSWGEQNCTPYSRCGHTTNLWGCKMKNLVLFLFTSFFNSCILYSLNTV